MADAPLRPCPGCRRKYTREKLCPACTATKQPRRRSKESQERQAMYDWRWRKTSERYRAEHPLCVECEQLGRTEPSTCVDHIVPHRGNVELFWNEENWAALCDAHHKTKTAKGL